MYIVVSFSHQNTNVQTRERLHFSDDESVKILPKLKEIPGIKEVMLLSTCNRCEIYAFVDLDFINLDSIKNTKNIKSAKNQKDSINPRNLDSKENMESMNANLDTSRFALSMTNDLQNLDSKKKSVMLSGVKAKYINENMQNIESTSIKLDTPPFATQKSLSYNELNLHNLDSITEYIIKILAKAKHIDIKEISNPQILYNDNAIKHIFCVASALVSLVVGETQISGQLKHAFALSKQSGFCGKEFERVINFAFRCASSVRSSTDISKNPVSIASIMANLALEFIQNKSLKSPKILIIGVGEMGKLSLKHLSKHNLNITLCNRTLKNAQSLLDSLNMRYNILDFHSLNETINDFDIIITAVGGGVIITESMLQSRRFDRVFFDLSMPRNVSFGSVTFGSTALKNSDEKLESILQNIQVVCIDDLKVRAKKHINAREQSLEIALKIVDEYVLKFSHYLSAIRLEPLIKNMRHKAKLASLKEINKAIKKGYIPEALRDNITKLAHSIFNEYLHTPTMNLRAMSEEPNADIFLESIFKFFGE